MKYKHQIPNLEFQISSKPQLPKKQIRKAGFKRLFGFLSFGYWDLFGLWCLDFGA
jgi:hypothetical protein